jgi:hypothetical protein
MTSQFTSGQSKRPYAAMQVSKLGKLADLTQAMFFGMYGDGGSAGIMTTSGIVPRP